MTGDEAGEIRAFVAVLLGDTVRRALTALLDRAAALPSDVKWVEPANLHVTVKFLGNVQASALAGIAQVLAAAARESQPFGIRLEGLGTFPPRGTPRVVWVGLKGEGGRAAVGRTAAPAVRPGDAPAALVSLAGAVDAGLGALGYAREDRPFAAHITLGRVRSPRGQSELKAFIEKEGALEAGAQWVTELALMRSDLRPAGPVYTKLAGFALGPAGRREGAMTK